MEFGTIVCSAELTQQHPTLLESMPVQFVVVVDHVEKIDLKRNIMCVRFILLLRNSAGLYKVYAVGTTKPWDYDQTTMPTTTNNTIYLVHTIQELGVYITGSIRRLQHRLQHVPERPTKKNAGVFLILKSNFDHEPMLIVSFLLFCMHLNHC